MNMAKKSITKSITINDLAGMVQKGFSEVHGEIADIRNTMATTMATKEDLALLRAELTETRETLARAISDLSLRLSAFVSAFREDYVRIQARVDALEEQVAELQRGFKKRAA